MIAGSGADDLTVGGKVFMYLFGPAIKTRKGRPYEAGEKFGIQAVWEFCPVIITTDH